VNVAVIGLGLIGGSLLRALAAGGHRVTGFDADEATRSRATEAGFTVSDTIGEAVAGADLVALAVPLPVLGEVLVELTGFDGLITDVASVKGPVLELARKHSLRRYVGGHPMAGKETSGFAASEPGLFDSCAWVLCLEPQTALDDWLTLAALVTAMGARVVPATATEHDRAVAEVSHMSHLFAAVLAASISDSPLAATLAAGSFRDGTRVAATRAELILAMVEGNRVEVGNALDGVIAELAAVRDRLDSGDLLDYLRRTGDARRAWPPAAGEPVEIPAGAAELLALGRDGGWVTRVAEDRATVVAIRPETDRNREPMA
jgi:prephenate dehydrogenase